MGGLVEQEVRLPRKGSVWLGSQVHVELREALAGAGKEWSMRGNSSQVQ